jgi:hypothetical protein
LTVFIIPFHSLLRKDFPWHSPVLLLFAAFLALEFFVRWSMDSLFIRRLNIFLPFLAILAAYTLAKLFKTKRGQIVALAIILYTAGLTIVSQSNSWNDPREFVEQYLNENYRGENTYFSPYARTKEIGPGVKNISGADILVLHESMYGRYWKFFTTPFKMPECCLEVYHCRSEKECTFYQSLLQGKSEDYKLAMAFRTWEWFPERVIFKKMFGSYETFLGDVLIYEKK